MKRLYGGATLVPSLVFKNVKAADPCAFDVSVPILQTKDPRLRRSRVAGGEEADRPAQGRTPAPTGQLPGLRRGIDSFWTCFLGWKMGFRASGGERWIKH